jgi:hypothetical protein
MDYSAMTMAATPAHSSTKLLPPPQSWNRDVTTVMMRNIPNKYTQGMLLTELNTTGFLGTYDFLYLPIDPETNANRGYAFVNFVDSDLAWAFTSFYEGRKMSSFNSSKFVSVTPATLQGFEANHSHYSASRVSRGDPAARPLFLREPQDDARHRAPQRNRGGGRRRGVCSAIDLATQRQQTHAISSAKQMKETAVQSIVAATVERWPMSAGATGAAGAAPAAPKFCPFCGGKASESFRFCQYCGANLTQISGEGGQARQPPAASSTEGYMFGSGRPQQFDSTWRY